MATEVQYFALSGGLDLESSPFSIKAGRALVAHNVEQVFGQNGYRRIDGYERFDGRPFPSSALTADERITRRAAIQPVPGSGPIRGMAVFKARVFAMRNTADGKAAALYGSSKEGWQKITDRLLPDGRLEAVAHNFGGASYTQSLYGCDGKNRPWRFDGKELKFLPVIFGSEADSTSSFAPALGDKTFTITQTNRSWKVDDELFVYDPDNPACWMKGKVKSYSGSSLVLTVTAMNGEATVSKWAICRADFADRPYLVQAFKSHLFLAYPNGQLQHSNLGDPLVFDSTAGLLGTGDDITGLCPLKGDLLAVFCSSRIYLLAGASVDDWQLKTHAQDIGARRGTAVETAGNALFLDDRGVTSLNATQAFGDFESGVLSREIKRLLDPLLTQVLFARSSRQKNQYRLYLQGGRGVTCTVHRPATMVEPAVMAFSVFQYLHSPTCIARGEDADGEETAFFGTDNGYVMMEDVGHSFDGLPIEMRLLLPFNHFRSPSTKKRFHRVQFEMESPTSVRLHFKQLFDFDSPEYASGLNLPIVTQRAPGVLDIDRFESFEWSSPRVSAPLLAVDGVGTNMALLLWHLGADVPSFTFQGVLVHYTNRGQRR